MIVSGYKISDFQKCKRPYRIGLTHRLQRWRPQSLFSACLRKAIFDLSSGKDVQVISDTAANFFLATARNSGLEGPQGIDTYTYVMDYIAMIRNLIEYLSRITLLQLYPIPDKPISDTVMWKFLSSYDESGVLHKWKFVDHLPDDPMAELHSWEVFGDIAAAGAPMVLHLVAIGVRSTSHQSSPWCRTYAHPTVANIYRFNKKSKDPLDGNWKPTYFSSNPKNKAKTWVDWMMRDNTPDTLMRHINVKEVSPANIRMFEQEVLAEAEGMVAVTTKVNPRDIPMSRHACDHPFTCPHQYWCYTAGLSADESGLYVRVHSGDPKDNTARETIGV